MPNGGTGKKRGKFAFFLQTRAPGGAHKNERVVRLWPRVVIAGLLLGTSISVMWTLWSLWSYTRTPRDAFPHDETSLTKTANQVTPRKKKKKGGGSLEERAMMGAIWKQLWHMAYSSQHPRHRVPMKRYRIPRAQKDLA
jgi:hypothetical protein